VRAVPDSSWVDQLGRTRGVKAGDGVGILACSFPCLVLVVLVVPVVLGRRVRTAADSERKVNPPAVADGARTDASRGAANASANASRATY
jgi:hypothetical protein